MTDKREEKLLDEMDDAISFVDRMSRVVNDPDESSGVKHQSMWLLKELANHLLVKIEDAINESPEIASKVYENEQFVPVRHSKATGVIEHNNSIADLANLNEASNLAPSGNKSLDRLFFEVDFIVKSINRLIEANENTRRKLTASLDSNGLNDSSSSNAKHKALVEEHVQAMIEKARSIFPLIIPSQIPLLCELPPLTLESKDKWIAGIQAVCEMGGIYGPADYPEIFRRVNFEIEVRLNDRKWELREKFPEIPTDETHLPEEVDEYHLRSASIEKEPSESELKRNYKKVLSRPLGKWVKAQRPMV